MHSPPNVEVREGKGDGLGGEKRTQPLGPLDCSDAARGEILIEPHRKKVRWPPHAIEIEMVKGQSAFVDVEVSEGGTLDGLFQFKAEGEPLDERGFSRSERSKQGQDGAGKKTQSHFLAKQMGLF
jgi:hypothetical protein